MPDLRTRSFVASFHPNPRVYFVEARSRWLFWDTWREVEGARAMTPEGALEVATRLLSKEPAPIYQLGA